MRAINFIGANATLVAPNCNDLPCHTDGVVCTTAWKLSDDELESILMSRVIVMKMVTGTSQPPVILSVLKPNILIEPIEEDKDGL